MKFHRIYAVILRHLYVFRHSADRLTDAFYWPTIDMLIWGITSSYFATTTQENDVVMSVISGLLMWIIVWRGQYEITISLLEELWNKNLVNLFVSPLNFKEWLSGTMFLGILKGMISFVFASIVALICFKVEIWRLGWYIVVFQGSLVITGWCIGFLITGLLFRYGTKIQTLVWTTAWLLAPFSGIYSPIAILPDWAQKIAAFNPASYIFENMRLLINSGEVNWQQIVVSYSLSLLYLVITFIFLKSSFNSLLNKKGLIKIN